MTASKGVMILHPDDHGWFVEAYQEACHEHAPFSAKLRMRRRGHAYRWMLFYGTPTFQQDGRFTGYVGSLRTAPKVPGHQ
jgi:PAS domain-containing protein